MNSHLVTYSPRQGTSPEYELSALAAAYRFVLDSAKKEAAPAGRPDAGKEIDERSGKAIIPK